MNLVCKKCLYPITHPLGINFDSNGICSGCLVHQEKKDKQWNMRLNKLKKIVKEYKKPNNEYDCIVPVNGGSDSFFTIFYVKEILKLKPLCVNYNSLYFNKLGHYNLSTLRRKFNVDINIHTPAKNQVLAINKASLYCKYSMYWHVHAGTTAYPLHVSIRKKIPLIIWGSNESVEQVGMFSHDDEVEMSRRYRHNHHLLSNELTDLEKVEPSIKKILDSK